MKKEIYSSSIKIVLGMVFILLLASSCKKLVAIPPNPPNQIAAQQVFADSTNAISAVTGVYDNRNFDINSGLVTVLTGLTSDELQGNINQDPGNQLFGNQISPMNSNMQTLWSSAYTSIYQDNSCLEGIQTSSGLRTPLKNQLLGELKVMRAFYYLNLINLFGSVPLVISTNYKVNAVLARASTDVVYAQIIADLSDASNLLSINYPSAGHARPNLYTAQALLAKVYLYRGQWQNAVNASSKVINSGVYSLEPDLNHVFLDGSNEGIWQRPIYGSYYQTQEGYQFLPTTFSPPNYTITSFLLASFEPGDKRRTSWVNSLTSQVNGLDTIYRYPFKYKNRILAAATTENYMLLRLGEQYLIRAEALAQQNQLPAALADLNIIRNRAGLRNSQVVIQRDILSAIAHERQTELFCEWGNRWYDLKRTGTISTVIGAEKSDWQPAHSIYPVPLAEIQKNPALIQNPGY